MPEQMKAIVYAAVGAAVYAHIRGDVDWFIVARNVLDHLSRFV